MPDACSCSHSKYTDQILTSAFRHLDISKDFIEKKGLLYIIQFILYYSVWDVILMHFNRSACCAAFLIYYVYLSLPGDGQSD